MVDLVILAVGQNKCTTVHGGSPGRTVTASDMTASCALVYSPKRRGGGPCPMFGRSGGQVVKSKSMRWKVQVTKMGTAED